MVRHRAPAEGINPGAVRRLAAVVVACAALGSWGAGASQQQQEPEAAPQQPIFRAGVNLVRVDVTATGRGDEPVADLQASDFEILEDKVPQTIQAFQFVRLTGEPSPGDDQSLEIRSRTHGQAEMAREDVRVFALFLDDYHISDSIDTTQRLRRALTEWAKQALKPTDVIVMMDPLTPISALEYTRSQADVIERVQKFKGRYGVYVPARSQVEEEQLRTRNPARLRAQVTLTAMHALVTHIGSLRERRSSVIFVSQGPPTYFADGSLEREINDVLEAANRFNVTINVLDPGGLSRRGASSVLWRMSGETGGRGVLNTNGLTQGLELITKDASAYYLIGYEPSRPQNDGKFHEIEVKVRRRGVDVLARQGYRAASEADLTAPRAPSAPPEVTSALNVLSQFEGRRPALTWIGFEPAGKETTRVALSWQPQRSERTSGTAAPEAVFVTAQQGSGTALPERRISLQDQATSSTGTTTFDLSPGLVKLTVRLEGKGGDILDRWTEDVDVPAFAGTALELGTPRVLVAHSVLAYRAFVAAPNDAVPSPQREFRRTDRVLVRMLVHGAPPGVQVVARLLNRAGAELVALPAVLGADSVAQVELPVPSLAAGEYVLRLEAQQDQEHAAQHVAFRVVP